MSEPRLGLYIHVPYCRVICPYCDFVKKRTQGDAPDAFVNALCAEIDAYEEPNTIGSVFFGGGTPSLLAPNALDRIMTLLRDRFDLAEPEITFEANPDDISDTKMAVWEACGVNRVLVGAQSFDDNVLRFLGRGHDAATARASCTAVANCFDNWGLDLIFGGAPVAAWELSLEECVAFNPPHVSTYSLTYEERTPFWKNRLEAIDDDTSLELYRAAMEHLSTYDHYEVSNFAREDRHSIHNAIYWRNEEYIGFGPGAYSYTDGVRARNEPKIARYLAEPGHKTEVLSLTETEIRIETLVQHFRTSAGIAKRDYQVRFHSTIEEDFGPAISALTKRGLLRETRGRIHPTQHGYELNNEIGLALVG